MLNQNSLQKTLKLISNENKFRIVQLLAKGEICVCDIGEQLGMEQSLVSHHLKSLKQANLISDRRLGNWIHYSLNKKAFTQLTALFTTYLGPKAISDSTCSTLNNCSCLKKEKLMSKKISIIIYDPPMCCSSGVCGPSPDQTLIDFQNMFSVLKKKEWTLSVI